MKTLLTLFGLHALADYPLQGDFLAKGKNQAAPLPGVPWQQGALAHALIHGTCVMWATDSARLGIAEFAVHAITDYAKCAGKLTFNQDQAIHYGSKVVWAMLAGAAKARLVASEAARESEWRREAQAAPVGQP